MYVYVLVDCICIAAFLRNKAYIMYYLEESVNIIKRQFYLLLQACVTCMLHVNIAAACIW